MARDFDGSTSLIEFTVTAAQKDLTRISIHFRAKRGSSGEGGFGVIGSHATGIDRRFHVENDNADAGWGLVFKAYRATAEGAWSIAYPTNDIWYDYVITYDHSSILNDPVWYKDGVSQTITERQAPSGAATSNDDSLYIGNTSISDQAWDGEIAEYAFWNRLLTPTEAKKLGEGHAPSAFSGGLVFYAPILGSTSPEPDIIGGASGTVTAASQVSHPTVLSPDVISRRMYLKQGFQ